MLCVGGRRAVAFAHAGPATPHEEVRAFLAQRRVCHCVCHLVCSLVCSLVCRECVVCVVSWVVAGQWCGRGCRVVAA